ncbi:MAG: hypothetical protein KAR42_02195 [candidate division Zixibacteria bacterium]|nr:hypothetical protein [candidate division Zixibacteria bacterium]
MNPARFRWGIFFIVAGLLLILSNFDYIDWRTGSDLFSLWPLILIAIGIEKIFAQSKMKIIAYLSPVLLGCIVIFVAVSGFSDSNLTRSGNAYRYNVGMETGYKSFELDFAMDDADLTVRGASSNDLIRCRFGGNGGDPETDMEVFGETVKLRIEETSRNSWIHFKQGRRSGYRWSTSVSNSIPLSLKCTGDKSDMRLDCRELMLESLDVDSDEGDISISIGGLMDLVKIELNGDDADYTITIPRGSGVKVTGADDIIYRRFRKIGLEDNGDSYMTVGYDTLNPKIELNMSNDISQFSLDYY